MPTHVSLPPPPHPIFSLARPALAPQQLLSNGDVNLTVEGLADLLIGVYDELNHSKLKKEKNIHDFVKQYTDVVRSLKQSRLHRDHFETVKVIGRGAFGEVHVVRHKASGRVYAMKVLNKEDMLKRQETACFIEERDVLVAGDRKWITELYAAEFCGVRSFRCEVWSRGTRAAIAAREHLLVIAIGG
jgi:serine/threonine protein kinase